MWAALFCITRFSSSLVNERKQGTLVRMQMAPITKIQILAGKALVCLTVIVVVSVALILFGMAVYGIRPVSAGHVAAGIAVTAFGFTGVMMALSVVGKTVAGAEGFGAAIMLQMAMTGGGMIPLIAMPEWMQRVGSISPVKWAILAIEGALWRGFSAVEMVAPCAVLVAVGVVCFAIGARLFRWEEA